MYTIFMAQLNTGVPVHWPDPIRFLHDNYRQRINDLMSVVKTGPVTRNMKTRITRSCRMWQLVLCCINHLYLLGHDPFDKLYFTGSYILSKVFNHLQLNAKDEEFLHIYDYIFGNKYIADMFENDLNLQKGYINFMCMTINNGGKRSIIHYFSVFHDERGDYYLNSSNGSEHVCIPQYTSRLTEEEWQNFITKVQSTGDNTDDGNLTKQDCILKYFLNFDGNDEEIDGLADVQRELAYYMQNTTKLHLLKVGSYSLPIYNLLESILDTYPGKRNSNNGKRQRRGGSYNRKTKTSRNRNKNKNKNKTINKKRTQKSITSNRIKRTKRNKKTDKHIK
jgi:hypothetical protein